jgi:hypothetical protein
LEKIKEKWKGGGYPGGVGVVEGDEVEAVMEDSGLDRKGDDFGRV